MNLIISFSARKGGNCDSIAEYISSENDWIIHMREISIQPCANCDYECMKGEVCKYRGDGIYALLKKFASADRIFFVVPMYCGSPSALYFILNERMQDFYMQSENQGDGFFDRLFVIGVYGSAEESPDFLRVFAQQYGFADADEHILGLERHKYHHKMKDMLLDEKDVREKLDEFTGRKI